MEVTVGRTTHHDNPAGTGKPKMTTIDTTASGIDTEMFVGCIEEYPWQDLVSVAPDEDEAAEQDTRLAEASDLTASVDALARLASDPDVTVRIAVACNRAASAELLERLALDAAAPVRRAVGISDATSSETLTRLAADVDWQVRWNAAINRHTPADALVRLAADVDERVRRAAMLNRALAAA